MSYPPNLRPCDEKLIQWSAEWLRDEKIRVQNLLDILAEGANPNIADTSGRTLLMWLLHQGDSRSAKALLKAGADANAVDQSGRSAIFHALDRDFRLFRNAPRGSGHGGHNWMDNVIEALVKSGADVNLKDSLGCAPITLATRINEPYNRERACRRLIDEGADIRVLDAGGLAVLAKIGVLDAAFEAIAKMEAKILAKEIPRGSRRAKGPRLRGRI